ncbi:hypothetical protein BJF79_45535 [Actinomadura sp. CNU-125]|nr:hypothetical protein BJF79_45535 [Actinomadura sp. CNU-125]
MDGPVTPVAAGGSPHTSQKPSTIVPAHPGLSQAPLGAFAPAAPAAASGAPDVAEPPAAGGEPQTSQKPSTIVPPHPG